MFSNKEILDGIVKNNLNIIKFLNNTLKPIVLKWIQKNKGTPDDASDIFQEAFIIIYRKLNSEGPNLELSCSFTTYFFSICKHLWFQELRKRTRYQSYNIDQFCNSLSTEQYDETEDRKFKIYLKQLNKLETKCRELLLLYCKKKSLSEIMNAMGFINAQAVADKKKNCRKKLIANLLNSKEYKELQSEILINN